MDQAMDGLQAHSAEAATPENGNRNTIFDAEHWGTPPFLQNVLQLYEFIMSILGLSRLELRQRLVA